MSKLKAFSTEELLETEFPPSGEFVDKQVLLDQLQRTKKLFEETGEKEKAECEQGMIDCVNQLMETYGYEEIEEFHEKAKVSKQGGKPVVIRASYISSEYNRGYRQALQDAIEFSDAPRRR